MSCDLPNLRERSGQVLALERVDQAVDFARTEINLEKSESKVREDLEQAIAAQTSSFSHLIAYLIQNVGAFPDWSQPQEFNYALKLKSRSQPPGYLQVFERFAEFQGILAKASLRQEVLRDARHSFGLSLGTQGNYPRYIPAVGVEDLVGFIADNVRLR